MESEKIIKKNLFVFLYFLHIPNINIQQNEDILAISKDSFRFKMWYRLELGLGQYIVN